MSTISVFGQKKIEITEGTYTFSVGEKYTYSSTIYDVEISDILSAWKKKLKSFKAKVSTDEGEMFGDNVKIKTFPDNNPIDIYTIFKETSAGVVEMHCCVNLGGIYLSNEQTEKSDAFKAMMLDFVWSTTQKDILNELKAAKSLLKKQESAHKRLVSKKKSLESKIKKYEDKIAQAKEDIEENIENQAKKSEEIEAQKKVVAEIQAKLDAFIK
jgi:hypothetical protein